MNTLLDFIIQYYHLNIQYPFDNIMFGFVHTILELFPISSSLIVNVTAKKQIILHFFSGIIILSANIKHTYFELSNKLEFYNNFFVLFSFGLGYLLQSQIHINCHLHLFLTIVLYALFTVFLTQKYYNRFILRYKNKQKPNYRFFFIAGFITSLGCFFHISRTGILLYYFFTHFNFKKSINKAIVLSSIINCGSIVYFYKQLNILLLPDNLFILFGSILSYPIISILLFLLYQLNFTFFVLIILLRVIIMFCFVFANYS